MRKLLEFFKCPHKLLTKLTRPTFQDLKLAIKKQETQKISQLLLQGAPTHQNSQSILHYATSQNKVQIVEFLSQHYPDLINQKNEDGDTPLILAIFLGNFKIIKCLLRFSNQNVRDNNGNTPFIVASANGNIAALEEMLQSCNNTMARNFQGQTALHRAAYYGQLETIKFLLKKTNLKIYQTDRNNNNSLHMACMSCNIICIRYIINKVKDSNRLKETKNKQNKSPFELLQESIQNINSIKKIEKSKISIQDAFDYILEPNQC